jgi:hypothetical protein
MRVGEQAKDKRLEIEQENCVKEERGKKNSFFSSSSILLFHFSALHPLNLYETALLRIVVLY